MSTFLQARASQARIASFTLCRHELRFRVLTTERVSCSRCGTRLSHFVALPNNQLVASCREHGGRERTR